VNKPIGVLGSGSFGTVITGLLLKNRNPVLIWGIEEDALEELRREGRNTKYLPDYKMDGRPEVTTSLEEVCKRCDLLFSVLPAKAVRPVMRELGNYARTQQIIVSCTKGLERKTLRRMTEIIKEETPLKKVGAMSGPNLAKEIAGGAPSSTLLASEFDEVIEEAHKVLNSDFFRVFGSHDVVGVQYCGSLKNIYAIASGAAQQLGYGLNTTSFLLTKALKEMEYFSLRFSAHRETFSGIAGVGDLIATAMSKLSRNFRFGTLIAQGKTADEALKTVNQTVEGYHTVHALYHYAKKHGFRLPITEAAYSVVYKKIPIGDVVEKLLQINVLYENELYA
jgi:glycerol-3-phosphate dehydrogenase (NAD(P)+)